MKKTKPFALAALVLVLLVAACGGSTTVATQPTPIASGQSTGTEPAAATAAQNATAALPAVAVDTPAVPADEGLTVGSVTEGLGQLTSYRSRYAIRFSGKDAQGQSVEKSYENQEEFTHEPRAQHVVFTTTETAQGQPAQTTQWESVSIGDTYYMITQDASGQTSCLTVSSGDATPPEQSLSPDMWGSVSDAQYVNTETVNGVRAKHYAWKEGTVFALGFASGKADTWVAVDGVYVVKQVIEGSGKGVLFAGADEEGTTTVEYNVTDANAPIEIKAPAGCEGLSTDIPLMADAKDKTSFGDSTSYTSASPFSDVVTFYKTEMEKAGWQPSGEPQETEELASLSYTKDTRTAVVMITLDQSNQTTSVFVSVNKE